MQSSSEVIGTSTRDYSNIDIQEPKAILMPYNWSLNQSRPSLLCVDFIYCLSACFGIVQGSWHIGMNAD